MLWIYEQIKILARRRVKLGWVLLLLGASLAIPGGFLGFHFFDDVDSLSKALLFFSVMVWGCVTAWAGVISLLVGGVLLLLSQRLHPSLRSWVSATNLSADSLAQSIESEVSLLSEEQKRASVIATPSWVICLSSVEVYVLLRSQIARVRPPKIALYPFVWGWFGLGALPIFVMITRFKLLIIKVLPAETLVHLAMGLVVLGISAWYQLWVQRRHAMLVVLRNGKKRMIYGKKEDLAQVYRSF